MDHITTATVIPLADGFLLECSGHAGYGEKEKDVVCAGVSALCMALESMLCELAEEGCAEDVRRHAADGYFSAEAHVPDGDAIAKERLETVFRTVSAGLAAIEALYPDHVQLIE